MPVTGGWRLSGSSPVAVVSKPVDVALGLATGWDSGMPEMMALEVAEPSSQGPATNVKIFVVVYDVEYPVMVVVCPSMTVVVGISSTTIDTTSSCASQTVADSCRGA